MFRFILNLSLFLSFLTSLQAVEFKLSNGDCFIRDKGRSFQKADKNQSIQLKSGSFLKAPYGVVGEFSFPAGKAKVDSELIFKVSEKLIPVMVQGTMILNLTDRLEIHTPTSKLKLQSGQFQLSIMEGFGVIHCIAGKGQIETTKESLQFKSSQKVVFSHRGNLQVKDNS